MLIILLDLSSKVIEYLALEGPSFPWDRATNVANFLQPWICLSAWLALAYTVNGSAAIWVRDLNCVSWAMDRRARFVLIARHGLVWMGILACALSLAAFGYESLPWHVHLGWDALYLVFDKFDVLISLTILGFWFAALLTAEWPRRYAFFILTALLIFRALGDFIYYAFYGVFKYSAFYAELPSPGGWYSQLAEPDMPSAPLLVHLNALQSAFGYMYIRLLLSTYIRVPLAGMFLSPLVNVLWTAANYWLIYFCIFRQRPLRRAARRPARPLLPSDTSAG